MPIILENVIQRSTEWFQLKAGLPSASSFNRIVTTSEERSKQYKDYLYELAGESIVGYTENSYTNYAIEKGIERVEESRIVFEKLYGEPVRQVGLVYKDKSRSVCCSPDGLVGDTGVELKNPILKTQTKYLLNGTLPTEYFQQVQGSMWTMNFKHYFFFSYYPGMPPFILLVKRDEAFISKLSKEMDLFVKELKEVIKKLRKL